MKQLPDLGKSFQLLKISTELEVCKGDSIIAESIRQGLRKPNNLLSVIEMIREQAKDNRQMISNIIGEDILREIENLETERDIPEELFRKTIN